MLFKDFFGEADFVKTVLLSRREPHLGGLRTLKNGIFSIIFWDVFLEFVLGAILINLEGNSDSFLRSLGSPEANTWKLIFPPHCPGASS